MAHAEVTRASMDEREWIELRADWLSRRVIRKRIQHSGWQIREARQVGEDEYEYLDSGYHPLEKGDTMFTPGGTSFLKLDTTMPSALEGCEVWFYLKTAGEMQVRANGEWLGAIDPNRQRLLLAEEAIPDTPYHFDIEAYNRSKPDDDRNIKVAHLRGCHQIFEGSSFVIIDHEIQDAVYDLNVLINAMNSEYVRDEVREYIEEHLTKALDMVDYEEKDPKRHRESVSRLRRHLKRTVFSSREDKGFKGSGKVALVAHSHLDVAYFWQRKHVVQKNARTCLVQLRLMDRYPEFCYAHTQPFLYETLEEHYPDLFEELEEKVDEGRFELTGGMYVEPDCNVPSAESLVRQCFYGQHYFRSRFGQTVNNCWLPDVFGNSWIMPQILRKSEIDYFVSNKMSTWNETNQFPYNHFQWKGIDGTEVGACVPPTHFITNSSPDDICENWEKFQEKTECEESLTMFGYGDGGSGVTEQMLEYIERIPDIPGLPEVRHCRGDQFLEDTFQKSSDLPVWDGELYLETHRGTFTSKAVLKQQNRQLEILLRDAEMMAALAALQGHDYPRETLTNAWKLILVNQFHDTLPGSHIAPVTEDALEDYARVEEMASEVLESAMEHLGLAGSGDNTDVINSLSWPRYGAIFVPENDVPACETAQKGVRNGKPGTWLELSEAEALPPLSGVSLDSVAPAEDQTQDWATFDSDTLELNTDIYRMVFAEDGSIETLVDKRFDRELAADEGRLNKLTIFRDNPGKFEAWDIVENYRNRQEEYEVDTPLHQTESGPVYREFSMSWRIRDTRWSQKIRVFRSDPRIEFEHDVDWHESHRLVKALFDFNMLSRVVRCDTSGGTVDRDTRSNTTWQQARFEVCHHKWLDYAESDYGVALLNESKYGVSLDENQVGLSLLRSPTRPDPNSDEGHHHFMYALLPHQGTTEEAGIVQKGWEFNTPLRVGDGGSVQSKTLMRVDDPALHVQAVKRPRDGSEGLIVRILETHGTRGTGTLALTEDIERASKTNLLEDVVEEDGGDYEIESGRLVFDYGPFEILTFRIQSAP